MDFNVKEAVNEVLVSSGYAEKRAAKLDIDDYLK